MDILTKQIIMENGMILEILVGLMAFLKVIFNYVESEKAVRIFGRVDDIINFFVKDKVKASQDVEE
jgi:hypothetical protein